MKGLASRPIPQGFFTTAAAASAAWLLPLTVAYAFRPDPLAALTWWPPWLWAAPGLLLLLLAAFGRRSRALLILLVLWLLYALTFSEEAHSLLSFRHWPADDWDEARAEGRGLRVVTLNAMGGSEAAMRHAAQYQPDLLLLQEAPGRAAVEAFAHELWGDEGAVAWGIDAPLAVHGEILATDAATGWFTVARVRFTNGREAVVASTHLIPPPARLDLWNPSCWSGELSLRRARREQLQDLVAALDKLPQELPVIVGGDFNAPGGDGCFSPFRPRLRDAFRHAGVGWGDTVLSDCPVSRIDQVWVSDDLRPVAVVARPNPDSDHRLVVAELLWQ